MIGQHIYSRCTQGYFGRSSGDSTTVTITAGMFPVKDQEAIIARTCEKIGFLEDTRKVPKADEGEARGILKVVRLNEQIMVVCRSWRISGKLVEGAKDFRDFTYSVSYILTGEDKDRFLHDPSTALLLDNYETYKSLQKRMHSFSQENISGYISTDDRYSVFNGRPESLERTFIELRLTGELYDQYIYAIVSVLLHRGQGSSTKQKIYVVLPEENSLDWESFGGNIYAEKLLLSTIASLPGFIASEISGISGGSVVSASNMLDPYQLVITEDPSLPLNMGNGYVIDLARRVTNIDTSSRDYIAVHELIQNITDKRFRDKLDENFRSLTGRTGLSNVDQGTMNLLGLTIRYTLDSDVLNRLRPTEIVDLCASVNGERTVELNMLLMRGLETEISAPDYDRQIEERLLQLLEEKKLDSTQELLALTILFGYMLLGSDNKKTLQSVATVLKMEPQKARQVLTQLKETGITADGCRADGINLLSAASVYYDGKDETLCGLIDDYVFGWINKKKDENKNIEALGCFKKRMDLTGEQPVFSNPIKEKAMFSLLMELLSNEDEPVRELSKNIFEKQIGLLDVSLLKEIWTVFSERYEVSVDKEEFSRENDYCFLVFPLKKGIGWANGFWFPVFQGFVDRGTNTFVKKNIENQLTILGSNDVIKNYDIELVQQISELMLRNLLTRGKNWFKPSLPELEALMKPLNAAEKRRDARLSILYECYKTDSRPDTFLIVNENRPQIWEIIFEAIRRGEFQDPLLTFAKNNCELRDQLIDIYKSTSLSDPFIPYQREIIELAAVYYELFLDSWRKVPKRGLDDEKTKAESFLEKEGQNLKILNKQDRLYDQIMQRLKEWAEDYPDIWYEFLSGEKKTDLSQKEKAVSRDYANEKNQVYDGRSYNQQEESGKKPGKGLVIICCVLAVIAVGILIIVLVLKKRTPQAPEILQTEEVAVANVHTEALTETESEIKTEQTLSEVDINRFSKPDDYKKMQAENQLIDQSESDDTKANNPVRRMNNS